MDPTQTAEAFSTTVAPWTPAHPRHDHQLVFPLSDGRLMLVWCEYYLRRPSQAFATPYSGERSDDDAPCQISARISTDNGRSWSAKLTLQENTDVDNVKHPNLLRLPSGRILFSYTARDMRNNDLRIYLRHSDDECESWSTPVQISTGTGVYFTNADHILRHSSGRILLPSHAGPIYGKGDHWQAFCLYSDDDGCTWQASTKRADLPARGAEEPAVVERADGSLLAILRTSLGQLYRATSEDRGETWSEAESTGLDSPAVATCMKRIPTTGDLLLIWNNAKPYCHTVPGATSTHQPRNPLTCAISRDDGTTWEQIRNVEDRPGYDNGYPSVTFVGDEALIGYYANVKSGVTGIMSELRLKIYPIDWFYS